MYFSLNYRKKKKDYKPNDELIINIRYYYKVKGEKKGKVYNHSTGIKVKLKAKTYQTKFLSATQ